MPEYVRVTDDVKPRREYSVVASAVTEAHKVLGTPATHPDGTPLDAKYTPESLSKSGQSADTTKKES